MFRETPSSIRRAFRGPSISRAFKPSISGAFSNKTKFRGTPKRRRVTSPHGCPACDSSFGTWVGVAGHMVRSGPDHHDFIEEMTGKVGASFYRPGGLKELAKILEDEYGASKRR